MKSKTLLFVVLIIGSVLTSLGQTSYFIYVSDAANFTTGPWKIVKYDANGDNPETFIDTNLGWPQDILFLEDQGVVLISNLTTGTINRHNASTGAFISSFATGIGGPTRMKIGADDLIYVLQWNGNGKVLRYEQDGTFVDEFTSTGVDQSIGLDWDSSGNLYVSSYTGDLIQQYSPTGADLGTFINSNIDGPTNIWFDSSGDLIIADYNGGTIKRFNSSGVYQGVYISGLGQPEGVAFYPDSGQMLLGNGSTGAVKLFTSSGTFIEDIVSPGSGGLITPNAVVLRDNTLSVSEFNSTKYLAINTIGRIFVLHEQAFEQYDALKVYTMAGQAIFEFTPDSQGIWNASEFASGVYFIVASKNGSKTTQKLIVK